MKTSDLTGAALDWAVAKCIVGNEMSRLRIITSGVKPILRLLRDGGEPHGQGLGTEFSTDWACAGPIIEREKLGVWFDPDEGWWATSNQPMDEAPSSKGATALIAAMRCFVASKLGPEVDVPAELVQDELDAPTRERSIARER